MAHVGEQLFSGNKLSDVIEERLSKLRDEIDRLDNEYIVNVSLDDLTSYLQNKYRLQVPSILNNETFISNHGEAMDDEHGSRKGIYVTFSLPFEGDPNIFTYRCKQFSMLAPTGVVNPINKKLDLTYISYDYNPRAIKDELDKDIGRICKWLEWTQRDLESYNSNLADCIKQRIRSKKEKYLRDQSLIESLNYLLKKNDDAKPTYSKASRKKKVHIEMPRVSSGSFKPEPTLDNSDYEDILQTVNDVISIIERSPSIAKQMKIDSLRNYILIGLNNKFDRPNQVETFSFDRKTDINIIDQDGFVFASECIYWKGMKNLAATIDLLLERIKWRESKAAIFIFSNNKDIEAICSRIQKTVISHKNFKHQIESNNELSLCFKLHVNGDKNKEFYLTINLFSLPK